MKKVIGWAMLPVLPLVVARMVCVDIVEVWPIVSVAVGCIECLLAMEFLLVWGFVAIALIDS